MEKSKKNETILFIFLILTLFCGCVNDYYYRPNKKGYQVTMEVTGYCDCGKCCSWERNWLFQAVFKKGKNKGKRKEVGRCADGTMAKKGTIAADTKYYPFGTQIYIPGYGYGTVHDRGGAIKGNKIDLFFNSHQEALNWGRKRMKVIIYK